MITRQVTIRDSLAVELVVPARPTKQLLIICHGYKSSSAHPALVAITGGLQKKGCATVTFNFSGPNPLDVPAQVADIHDIIMHFASQYTDIVLIAGSFGALSAAIAARSPYCGGIVTVNGFFGSGQVGRRHKPTFWTFRVLALASSKHQRVWRFYRRELQPHHINVPALVIHSKVDNMVSIRQSRWFFEKLQSPKQFIELEDADHDLSSVAVTTKIVEDIADWLKRLPSHARK